MKKGQRVIITTGEYSDFGIRDSFRVLKDFSFDKVLAVWLKHHATENGYFGYSSDDDEQAFLESLREGGFVVDEPLNKVHLSDYNRPAEAPAGDAGDGP